MNKDKVVVLIPVRMKSTRLPGKVMIDINGKSLIQRVYENVKKVYPSTDVFIAADDQKIAEHMAPYGVRCVMTDPELPSGTDRIAAALKEIDPSGEKYDIVVNFQGDGVNVDPALNNKLIDIMVETRADIVTVCQEITEPADIKNPTLVKIAMGLESGEKVGRCLYFSRSPIPYDRNKDGIPDKAYWHIGIYVYNAKSLQDFVSLPEGVLERTERLEQLRALESGMSIYALLVDDVRLIKEAPADINTPEEHQEALKWIK
ncbi:MAG: 3-deoxy-manno-octulosonate cytidylyltransferase [Lactobacillus sp.]|jgi:3-deoxy-manno-octulosonate cytidylyltransferase (CMP-KDO synthetase)|nr:3-deoxy-manno-octulosonate cytidylyltransferase [Lactobacillus sp.]